MTPQNEEDPMIQSLAETESWVEADVLPVLDRSELELWATCPQQAALLARGMAVRENALMTTGQAVHDCFSAAIAEYIGDRGDSRPAGLVDVIEGTAQISRPDIQPDVIRAVNPSKWAWSKFIAGDEGINPRNILRYDGGRGDMSGQLAVDLTWPAVRITSELDLIYAGPSPEVLHGIDYKSGHKQWTARDVQDSFQFQMHAFLVFENYPAINGYEVTIWNTRSNTRSYRVMLHRADKRQYEMRVTKAASIWAEQHTRIPEKVAAWPEVEKCGGCPVAAYCSVNTVPAETPVEKLQKLIVLEAESATLKKELGAIVKATGRDVTTEAGDAFGQCKPPGKKAKPNAIYSVKNESESDDE